MGKGKHYENRNKSVLVLCPKKLAENGSTYKDNYVNNPIAAGDTVTEIEVFWVCPSAPQLDEAVL